MAGIATHPNIGGYVIIGLGCEVNQVSQLIDDPQLKDSTSSKEVPPVFTIQQVGGVSKTVDAAITSVEALLPSVNACQRTLQPISKLRLALNCGGSDGNSGITCNPALGAA